MSFAPFITIHMHFLSYFLYMFNQKLWMFKSWSTCILIILLLWFTIFCWFLYESISDSWVSRYGGFYSHEDVREVVQYAQQRGITVIPEIDIPGHCYAAIQALPELSESVQKEGAPRSVQGWDMFVERRFRFCFFGSRFSSNRCSLYLFFSSNFLNKNNKEKTRTEKKWKKTDFFPKRTRISYWNSEVSVATCWTSKPRWRIASSRRCSPRSWSSSRDASCTSAWMKFLQKPGRTIRKKRREIGVSEELKKCVSS